MVIFIADWDDPDMKQLSQGKSIKWIKLGLDHSQYEVYQDKSGWWLRTEDEIINNNQLEDTSTQVIYRRWRTSPPRSFVSTKGIKSRIEKNFIERQWDAALSALFMSSWRMNQLKWSRCPAFNLSKADYYHLLREKIRIPEYWITQSVINTGKGKEYKYVLKSIHNDQSYGKGHRVSTIPVTQRDYKKIQPVPSILQKQINSTSEWRVLFLYGMVAMVSITNGYDDIIDKRFADIVSKKASYSESIANEANIVSDTLLLKTFTADVLFDSNGLNWWCDINSDGLALILDDPISQPFMKTYMSLDL